MGEFNLIDEPWIPVLAASGERRWIRPAEISSRDDPPRRVSTGRPDFDGALTQFLIGLVQTCATPRDDRAWREWIKEAPAESVLHDAFVAYRGAFFLTGDGPRYLQDQAVADLGRQPSAVDTLLLDSPGENTTKENKDHFVHRDRFQYLALPSAAAALTTLQMNAAGGGQGNRVAIRGGGPLTTLIVGETLWMTVWANILVEQDLLGLPGDQSKTALADIFPWMGPTRTSERGQAVHPQDVHPLQHYWGTPRRLLLEVSSLEQPIVDPMGVGATEVIERYLSKNHGNNYQGAWNHPLTPYTVGKNGEPPNPKKAQPTGLSYCDWPLYTQKTERSSPAKVVDVYYTDGRWAFLPDDRLAVFGYDLDNMKARCWYSGITPLVAHGLEDEGRQRLADAAACLVAAAEDVRDTLVTQVKHALADPKRKTNWESTRRAVSGAFWADTERSFFTALSIIAADAGDGGEARETWLNELRSAAGVVFQRYSQASADFSAVDAKRLAVAWNNLRKFTSPRGKKLRATVGLPPSETKEAS